MDQSSTVSVVLGLHAEAVSRELARMVRSVEGVGRVEQHGSQAAALRSALRKGEDCVLVLALAELDPTTAAACDMAGLKLLLAVEDAGSVHSTHLTSVRSHGILELRDVSEDSVRDCLRRMACGQLPVPASLARRMLTPDWAGATRSLRPRLTPREREVLHLLVDGLSNKQIGRRLSISDHGVKRLVANILAKLDCGNRTQAVSRAIREGLCERALGPGLSRYAS